MCALRIVTLFLNQLKTIIMSKRFFSAFVVITAMLVSCVQNEMTEPDGAEITAKVEASSLLTKCIVDESQSGSPVGILWDTKESIGVYGRNMTNTEFVSTNSYKNTDQPTFRGKLFSSPQYAYYPYNSENASSDVTSVRGKLPQKQNYSLTYKKMNTDYKIGKYKSGVLTSYTFTFSHILTFVRLRVNVDDTPLEGNKLYNITMEVTKEDGSPRQLCGGFTFDLTRSASEAITSWDDPKEGDNKVMLIATGTPTLSVGNTYNFYLSSAPYVKKGDQVKFVVTTDQNVATFTTTAEVDYTSGGLVEYSLQLANIDYSLNDEEEKEDETPSDSTITDPENFTLKSFKFEVSRNTGKILGKKLSYNKSSKATTYTAVTEEICTIDNENHKITAYIPYLNDRKLIPTFEIPEGLYLIYPEGIVTSGETLIDFSIHKQVAVINEMEEGVIYDVELVNTGLPVVVINQETGTVSSTSDSEFAAASNAWFAATGAKWQLKESDWLMTDGVDNLMIYNADGTSALTDKNGATVNKPVLSSTRERGNVSRQMPKKPFAVKLDKKHGIFLNDNDNTNDLPAHKRWVLLANWKDRTLMRNAVANEVAAAFNKTFPNDGIAWNPSGQFVELVYNGVHVGNYYLCEQVKIDENRLDINEPYDVEDAYSGNAAGYGYLLESDDGYDEAWKFMTKMYIPFLFKDDGNDEMLSYAQNLVRGVEDNLRNGNYSTAYNTLDLSSMVDFLLIQELMMNCELQHPKSMYSYINNGKLYAGPIWDFDWNTLAVDGNFECGYSYTKSMLEDSKPRYYSKLFSSGSYPSVDGGDKSYMWYPMLVKDATFKAKAAERWNAVQGALAQVSANIPKTAEKIRKSEACNYAMWQVDTKSENIRGNRYGISGGDVKYCGYCGDETMTFDQAVQTLKSNFDKRISGMSYVSSQSWPSKSVSTVRW